MSDLPSESFDITPVLATRASRSPDYAAQSHALQQLVESIADSEKGVLQALARVAMLLCRADSAGVSLLEHDGSREYFRWTAACGKAEGYLGHRMPRTSPCGVVLDANAARLMARPEEHFDLGIDVRLPLVEVLLVPFRVAGAVAGTLWIVSHRDDFWFDREDLRIMNDLSRFASIIHANEQMVAQLQASQERNALLARELAHRSQNTIALVRSILSQSARHAETPEALCEAVDGRLLSLAGAQEMLISGEQKPLSLFEMVARQLEHLDPTQHHRVEVVGDDIALDAGAARSLAMVIHELSTNAVKYGALADPGGRVVLSARVARDDEGTEHMTLQWREHDGPPVAPPRREGYGTSVITAMLEHNLGARVSLVYARDGLDWQATAPLSGLAAGRKG